MAASQLVDAYRFSHSDNRYHHLTSPEFIAANYKANFAKTSQKLSWGETDKSLKTAVETGSCNRLESRLSSIQLDQILDVSRKYREASDFETKESLKRKIICEISPNQAFSNTGFASHLQNILDTFKNPIDHTRKLLSLLCEGNQISLASLKGRMRVQNTESVSTQAKLRAIRQIFAQRPRQPVAVGVTSREPDNFGDHALIIAGQREKDGRCQFKIRDSYGVNNCATKKYPPYVECVGNGNLWVDQEKFVQYVDQITWLVPKTR